jgi:protein SCO1/2
MIELIPAASSPAAPGVFGRSRFTPPRSARDIIRQKSFPNVPLVTHRGKDVRFYDDLLKNKIVVLSVISAQRAAECAALMSALGQVQKILFGWFAEDVHFYSITATPEQDTPETLHAFADAHNVRGHWWLLTGAPADVDYLRGMLGWTPEGTREGLGAIRYGNEQRALWAACDANAAPGLIAEGISFVIRRPIVV